MKTCVSETIHSYVLGVALRRRKAVDRRTDGRTTVALTKDLFQPFQSFSFFSPPS